MKKKIILILCLAVMLTAFLSYSVFADEVDLVENVEKIEITEEFGENEAIEKAGAYLYSKIEITDKGEVVPLEDVIFEGSFSDVADYLNYSKKGGIIVLKENVKLEKNITLQSVDDTVAYIVVQGDNVFFDLNGYVLTQQSGYKESLNSVFVVPQNNSLKIIDSSEKKNGAVNGVHGAVSVTGGELSLSGGTLKAQAQASIESDDGELVVSILDNGIFKMDGGKIDFNGSLEDGRTYYDTSCSLYVDDLSVAYISANSIVKGEILTDDKWSLFIYGGTFDYDISDYVSKDMKVVKNGEVYTVEGIFSDKIDAIYHGMEIEAVVIPKKDTVNGDITEIELVVRPLSDVKERNQDGKICIELNDIIKEMRYLG
ncbi:MAG: hypothetical protein IKV88_03055, partial [Clostridia bacterium]|nr:hypothetical protein [Clostridia bacterium]